MKKGKILFLGADGFIGSNLVEKLQKNGFSVRAFDIFPNGKSKNLEHLREKIEFFPGDFLKANDLEAALKSIDYVFHFISFSNPVSSMDNPEEEVFLNIQSSVRLLNMCADKKIKKIVYASTGGALYGNNGKSKIKEDHHKLPISPYGIGKLTIEKYLEYFKIHKNLNYVSLRFSNPFGPKQNIMGVQGAIPIFLNLIKNDKEIAIYGDGENIRDFIFIDDMCEAAVKLFMKRNLKYSIFNVGSGKSHSLNKLIKIMEQVTKIKPKVKYLPDRKSDIKKVVLDIKRAKSEIGHYSKTSLKDGIKKTWDWLNMQ